MKEKIEIEPLIRKIKSNISLIFNHQVFQDFKDSKELKVDDYILFNNSFIFRRDIKTNKSPYYLGSKILKNKKLTSLPEVFEISYFNINFKLLKQKNATFYSLEESIKKQLKNLGKFIFILVGQVDDSIIITKPLNHKSFESVQLNPTCEKLLDIKGKKIIISDAVDKENIWKELSNQMSQNLDNENSKNLKEALSISLDKIQAECYAKIRFPSRTDTKDHTIVWEINQVLKRQRDIYKNALNKYNDNPKKNSDSYNEILRIAYNFSSDALPFIQLLIRVCDLKPIVLWGTIGKHFMLSEAFRNLPWVRTHKKASLKNYINTIGDARNHAFHNIFPFNKSLEVELPSNSFQNAKLRIFSEYTKKSENELKYEDKELIEALKIFTRARERFVPFDFWEKNLEVMNATINLFDSTNEFIMLLSQY